MHKKSTPVMSLRLIVQAIQEEYFKSNILLDYKPEFDFNKIRKMLAMTAGFSIENVDRLALLLEKYAVYLDNMMKPRKRNYGLLIEILEACTQVFSAEIEFAISSHKFSNIENIIDIGAGHLGYARILAKVLPDLDNYIAIDKRPLSSSYEYDKLNLSKFDIINKDVFDVLDDLIVEYKGKEEKTLIVLSEFLHCKDFNMGILRKLYKTDFNILIIDLLFNPVINVRLNASGGGLIDFNNLTTIFSRDGRLITMNNFNTLFPYYAFGVQNVK